MNKNNFPEYFSEIKSHFLKQFNLQIEGLSSHEVLKSWQSIHSNKGKEIVDYYMEISLETLLKSKKIIFSVYDGYNAEVKRVNSIILQIENTTNINNYKRNKFSIIEYFSFKKIDSSLNYFFEINNEEQSIESIKLIIDEIIQKMKNTTLEKILKEDYWEDIPIDFTPYK